MALTTKEIQSQLARHPSVARLFFALAKATEGKWHAPSRVLSSSMARHEWQDLVRNDSLTQHLASLILCPPQVTLRYSGVNRLFQHEAESLGARYGFVREVILHPPIETLLRALPIQAGRLPASVSVPVLLCARTVCLTNAPLAVRLLSKLKSTSLGKTLFHRGPPICYARHIARLFDAKYARKSVFGVKGEYILVSEIPLWEKGLLAPVNL